MNIKNHKDKFLPIFLFLLPFFIFELSSIIFQNDAFPWRSMSDRSSVTVTTITKLISPDGRWTAEITDIRHETDWFHITDLVSEVRLQRAGSTRNSALIVGSATNSDPELRPQARWIAPDRLCVVAPAIRGMDVQSGIVEGARVDLHILPWNQKWPPPKIDLDAQCR